MTQAICDDPEAGPAVLHFAIPVRDPGVAPQDSWYALGMRGTGSQDVIIRDVFVPNSGILLRRPVGKLSEPFHLSPGMIPLPLVYAVYLGVAEAAYDTAVAIARKRPHDHGLTSLIGEMHNDLAGATMAYRDMVEAAAAGEPGLPNDEPDLDRPHAARPHRPARRGKGHGGGGHQFVLPDVGA